MSRLPARTPGPPGRPWVRPAVVVVLLALLIMADVYATHRVFTSKYPGANDFYSRWRAAQAYWLDGIDPYSEQATQLIQDGIYGRSTRPGEDPGPFAYPFYTVFLLYPLVWLPYPWVEAIWLVLLQASLIVGMLLTLRWLEWRLPPLLVALSALWAVVFYHGARALLLGQFAGLVFLWTVGILYALKRSWDVTAGVLLALTTIKPQMSVLLIPALVVWAMGQRRWRFLGAAGATMVALGGASFALLPGWLGEFAGQLRQYPAYTAIGSPVWIISHFYLPGLGTPLEIGLSVLLVFYLLFEWRHLPRSPATCGLFYWLVGLTLIVTNLVVLRTATTNYVVLYIPLLLALKVIVNGRSKCNVLLALFYLLSVAAVWALFFTTVVGRFEHPVMYLLLPIGLFVVFIGTRRITEAVLLGAADVTNT